MYHHGEEAWLGQLPLEIRQPTCANGVASRDPLPAARLAGRLKVAKLNVDHSPQTARQFDVQGIPTLLILHSGREVDRQVGVLLGDAFPRWIEQAIAKLEVS